MSKKKPITKHTKATIAGLSVLLGLATTMSILCALVFVAFFVEAGLPVVAAIGFFMFITEGVLNVVAFMWISKRIRQRDVWLQNNPEVKVVA